MNKLQCKNFFLKKIKTKHAAVGMKLSKRDQMVNVNPLSKMTKSNLAIKQTFTYDNNSLYPRDY